MFSMDTEDRYQSSHLENVNYKLQIIYQNVTIFLLSALLKYSHFLLLNTSAALHLFKFLIMMIKYEIQCSNNIPATLIRLQPHSFEIIKRNHLEYAHCTHSFLLKKPFCRSILLHCMIEQFTSAASHTAKCFWYIMTSILIITSNVIYIEHYEKYILVKMLKIRLLMKDPPQKIIETKPHKDTSPVGL